MWSQENEEKTVVTNALRDQKTDFWPKINLLNMRYLNS